jgi:hypothetical protein
MAAARCLSSSILSSPICPEFHELRVSWPRPPDFFARGGFVLRGLSDDEQAHSF